jgi:hypothetical protein
MIDQVKKRFKTFEAGLNGAGEGKWHQQRLEALNAFHDQWFARCKR